MSRQSKQPEGRYAQARAAALADFERTFVRDLLEETNGHVAEAARAAGMDRLYFHRLMKRHGVTRHAVRVDAPVTNEQIEELRAKAVESKDFELMRECDDALNFGSYGARTRCARIINGVDPCRS